MKPYEFSYRDGEGFANGFGEPFDLFAPRGFGNTDQTAFRELGIVRAQSERPDDFVA
jgi:hypothetical protein